ncbi:UNVERIFIED_CONTAM: hypothetical protein GTU68_055337 [Idotea baltica]|nr:hypothetical protein [Idotea baltica]
MYCGTGSRNSPI